MRHTNTTIYRRSLELVALTRETIAALPTGHGFLADQIRRSSASVTLNFAEGSGKASSKERRRYFRIARASVLETAAAFDVGAHLGAISEPANEAAQDLCDHLSAMLHRYR